MPSVNALDEGRHIFVSIRLRIRVKPPNRKLASLMLFRIPPPPMWGVAVTPVAELTIGLGRRIWWFQDALSTGVLRMGHLRSLGSEFTASLSATVQGS